MRTSGDGILHNAAGGTLIREGSSGTAAIVGLLINDGLLIVQSGTLAVEIEGRVPGPGYDRLAVKRAATLDGTLLISSVTGFDPPLDSTYDVVTALSRDGKFATLNGRALSAGKRYKAEYERNLARLRVVRGEPIIFIHGFLGSRVVCHGGGEAWPNVSPGLPQPLAMRLAADGVTDLSGPCTVPDAESSLIESVLGADIYGSTVQFLKQAAPVGSHIFVWDWRKSPEQALERLDALVDQVGGGDKVVLMAHSMGGLLTRWYIDDPSRAQKVARAVTIGTPYWGSAKALFPLAAGVEMPLPSALDALFSNAELKQFAGNLQGLYFLWPSTDYGAWLTVDAVQSGPLDRPTLLEYVDFLGGNQALLRRALADHALHLDDLKLNGVDYHVLVGTGLPTIGRVRISSALSGANYEVRYQNGDGTVPRESARLGGRVEPGRLHFVCGIEHVALPGHPEVTSRIRDFLLTGAPIGGPERDCRATGVEVQIFNLTLGASAAAAQPPTLAEAAPAGLIDLLDLGAQKVFVANAAHPVKLRLRGQRLGLRVTPLRDGRRGKTSYYGPVSGALTLDAAADARIRKGGKLLAPQRRADHRPPRTRVRLRLRGPDALLRFRATDSSGVAATHVKVGKQAAKPVSVGRPLRVRRNRSQAPPVSEHRCIRQHRAAPTPPKQTLIPTRPRAGITRSRAGFHEAASGARRERSSRSPRLRVTRSRPTGRVRPAPPLASAGRSYVKTTWKAPCSRASSRRWDLRVVRAGLAVVAVRAGDRQRRVAGHAVGEQRAQPGDSPNTRSRQPPSTSSVAAIGVERAEIVGLRAVRMRMLPVAGLQLDLPAAGALLARSCAQRR